MVIFQILNTFFIGNRIYQPKFYSLFIPFSILKFETIFDIWNFLRSRDLEFILDSNGKNVKGRFSLNRHSKIHLIFSFRKINEKNLGKKSYLEKK